MPARRCRRAGLEMTSEADRTRGQRLRIGGVRPDRTRVALLIRIFLALRLRFRVFSGGRRQVGNLPPDQALRLRLLDGLTPSEIGKRTGQSVMGVHHRVRRGAEMLRGEYEP
jgi:hypothetical protein